MMSLQSTGMSWNPTAPGPQARADGKLDSVDVLVLHRLSQTALQLHLALLDFAESANTLCEAARTG